MRNLTCPNKYECYDYIKCHCDGCNDCDTDFNKPKMILVGMTRNATTQIFFNHVLEQLIRCEIDVTDLDRQRFRFKTPNTEVWFVDDYYAKYFLEGIRPAAIFGELYPELLAIVRKNTLISSRDRIGLVDYICKVEREASESHRILAFGNAFAEGFEAGINGYPKSIYISTARHSGKTAFENAIKCYLAEHNVPYIEVQKGEINMAEHNIHIRPETASLAELSKTAAKFLSAYHNRPKLPGIKNVIFSGPCTIVLWEDGTKTVVRCEKDVLDPEKGLAMAIAKKALGTNKSGSNYYDIFKKWLPKPEVEEEEEEEVKQDG